MIMRRSGWLRFALLALLAALCICSNVYAAQVRAWLDRSSMQLGETVTLNVEVSDDASASQPDFSVLQQDFNLLGTQSSTSMNIINGQASSKLLWAVGLEPKRAGSFTIPALTVGGAQTQPLPLVVNPGSASSNAGKAGDDVFVEVSVEPKNPYVQQQIRVTMKLFYAVNLTDGNVEDPHGEGLIARKLGQDTPYTADVDGRRYHVLERHYALTPEKSGTLTLAPIVFRGHAVTADINSFFNRGRAVSAQSPAVAFDVRPRPAASGTDAWLPAQSLTLTASGIDSGTSAHVGEPLTLTLHAQAKGLGFEQLPELKLPKIDGADIYPDKETTVNRDDGVWQLGERERKFAIVPNRAGALTLPALSLQWWDTEHDRAASVDLPATTLNVAPALPGAAAANVQNATNAAIVGNPVSTAAAAPPSIALSDAASAGELRTWRMLALAALGLWILTLIGIALWWFKRRGPRTFDSDDGSANLREANARTLRKAFNDACAQADASAAARALLAWAHAEGSSVRTLGELARALEDDAQRAALAELDRARYGGGSVNGVDLAAAFRGGLRFATAQVKSATSLLPPLYPFNLAKDPSAPR
jgi:hypothetical protein